MSTGYALAAVTAVLRQRIIDGLAADGVGDVVGPVAVSAQPPDRILKPNQPEPTQINLYLHQVMPNAAWRNVGLPSRDSGGEAVANPPLALTLHYLVSAFGAEMFVAEILLGHVVRILHENMTLTREAIRRALTPPVASPLLDQLAASALADQVELVKLTPATINTEEMSRLWSAFQAHYRTTAAYEASVVLIDGRARARPALPATGPAVFADALQQPRVTAVRVGDDPRAPLTTESVLTVVGERLAGPDGTTVTIGDTILAAADVRADAITLDLAAAAPRPRAGVQALGVTLPRLMGDPAVPHQAYASNVLPIVLRPVIASAGAANGTTATVNGVAVAAGTLTLTFARAVGRGQRVELLLNEKDAPADRPPRGFVIPAAPGNGFGGGIEEAASVGFAYDALPRGDYVVRARVDGAESLLVVGPDGRFAAPAVTI